MALSVLLILVGLGNAKLCKSVALAGCFLVYCALTSSLAPLEGGLGRFDQTTIQALQGKEVWVPCDYRAKDEEYRLLIPGAILHGYLAKDAGNVPSLTSTYPLVAVQLPMGVSPQICESCQVLSKRMEMRARHSDAEITAMLMGHIGEYLFVNEFLIATPAMITEVPSTKDACR